MVERSRIRLLTGALASVLLPGLSGCVSRPYEGPPSRGHPPHYYDYYYYPHREVYYHVYTGHYYYYDGSIWLYSRRLPDHIRLDTGHRVRLKIRDDKPWHRHQEHRRKYPPPPEHRRGRREPMPQRPERRTPSPAEPRRGKQPARREERRLPSEHRRGRLPSRPEKLVPPAEPRHGKPTARREGRPSPPEHRRDREREREEREHNISRHEEIRKKPR